MTSKIPFLRWAMILSAVFFLTATLNAQDYEQDEDQSLLDVINWQHGPSMAEMEDIAEIRLPGGYVFANKADAQALMEAMGNIVSNNELGLMAPETFAWFVVFEFSDVGYVKDDEKNELDADAMIESIRKGTEESNKYREDRGFTAIHVLGWETTPHYDDMTHNLEWAIKLKDDNGDLILNHNTRILGRKGVMEVTLVVDPDSMANVLPIFREHLNDFSFKAGHKYAEFRDGDKIAKYGLTGLVVGGAAAVAAKSGLFKWLWKLIVVGIASVGVFFKRIFGKKDK